MGSHPNRQQYANALSAGMQSDRSEQSLDHALHVDWAVVEAAGSLGNLALVRQGFLELSQPVVPAQ